jgi:Dolichyl-phosphate-mannose-protein mannosyltransferase
MKPRRAWLVVAAALLIWALWVAISGGLYAEWSGWRFSSRQASRPVLAAALLLTVVAWRRGLAGMRGDLAAFRIDFDRWSLSVAVAIALAVLGIGLFWGTRIAGGADSYGYLSQSRLWAQGTLIVSQPIAATVPWPHADWTFTPLGYTPWTGGDHSIVPIYAPGLPMLMALFSVVHSDAVFWVVPLAGAGLIVFSFFLGRSLGGPGTGLLTAALMATSPAFLFQLVAPMSDVVIAAFWVAALVLALPNRRDRWLGSGLASSFAILTRPNTTPIAIVFALAALAPGGSRGDTGGRTDDRARFLNAVAYATGILPGVLSVAAIHTALYGSPFESGYGSAADLYSLRNFPTNAGRYLTWFVASETPFICVALAAPFLGWRSGQTHWRPGFAGSVAAVTWLCYLFYQPFDDWWYLRFLLTSFPCLLALAAVPLARLLKAATVEWRMPLAVAVLTPILMWRIDYAIRARSFDSWKLERRYADTGRMVVNRLETNAVLISWQQSGSLRYYSGRLTLRWDWLEPAWLDRSIEILEQRGLKPYFVLEEMEEADFRKRFASTGRLGRLDWPALVELTSAPIVRIYDPAQARP